MSDTIFDKKILLADDENDIIDLIEEVLRKEGFFNIIKAGSGLMAVERCRTEKPELIILDVMFPDLDGIEACKRIRAFSICPILFLSSKNDEIDKILGLSSGGDDYITKPFSPKELVYRIKAQLRRQQYNKSAQNTPTSLKAGELFIDREAFRVWRGGKELSLTAKEFQLLLYLCENANKVVSKEQLYEKIWGQLSIAGDNTIMVHIRHLREKIEDVPSNPKQLVTIKGLGYKLVVK